MKQTEVMNEQTVHELTNEQCVPCQAGTPPLRGNALRTIRAKLGPGWDLIGEHHLEKEFNFRNFRDALAFTNRVGELAEQQNHHPDIYLTWGKVRISIWTHKVEGLTQNDFVLAAKIDDLGERSEA